jgi:hypothetical protein
VSLWSHKSLRVVISPDQVAVLPLQDTLGLRGQRRSFRDPRVRSCTPSSGGQPWRAAVRELETALAEFTKGGAAATVILSNHFLRYTLVPWHAELADADEEQAFARHCFSKVYGNEAQAWELRLSHEAPEMPRLASAVDAELLSTLRGVFAGAAVPLRSIQPHLMAAFNGYRKRLPQPGAWFALLEPGNLCLVRVQRGNWMQLRSVRIGNAWREELPLILEREAFLADSPEVPHEVYVCGAEPDDAALPQVESWRFHALAGGLDSGRAPARPVSMAMAG